MQTDPNVSRTNLTEGRANQKQRTYQALLDAALGLSEAGQQPTLRDIANKAMVSRATAYRYFPSVDALIHEAYFGRAAVPLDTVLAAGSDPVEAIGHAAAALNGLLLENESGVHIVERAFMQVWLNDASEERPARRARRMRYIDPIVDSLSGRLDDAAQLLGHPYRISGHVVHGRKLGRALDCPTLNLRFVHWKPAASGIFVVQVHRLTPRPLAGVANLGVRPSLDAADVNRGQVLLETHCLDWPSALGPDGGYAKIIRVELLHKLHDERKYDGLDALRRGIAQDCEDARDYFAAKQSEIRPQRTRDRI